MEGEVFLPVRVLHAYRDGYSCGFCRSRPEDRQLFEHNPQVRVVVHQREHVRHGAPAITATVVEELNKRDVAVGIAECHLMGRGKQSCRIVFDCGATFAGSFCIRRRRRGGGGAGAGGRSQFQHLRQRPSLPGA